MPRVARFIVRWSRQITFAIAAPPVGLSLQVGAMARCTVKRVKTASLIHDASAICFKHNLLRFGIQPPTQGETSEG